MIMKKKNMLARTKQKTQTNPKQKELKNAPSDLNCAGDFLIRRSTPADLKAIHKWLVEEKAQGVNRNFLCNWRVIEQAHRQKELFVCVEKGTNLPVAFQSGGLTQDGIFEVRQDYRGKGIGRMMVEHCIALASEQNECLLYIESVFQSTSFWQKMGFTVIENPNGDVYAYRTIDKRLRLPKNGSPVAVVIRFFHEKRKYGPGPEPYTAYSPKAKLAPDGIVYLSQRVQFHEKEFPDARDVVIEIVVDGKCRYCDKAKYADQIGVQRCTYGFYIDRVNLASPLNEN